VRLEFTDQTTESENPMKPNKTVKTPKVNPVVKKVVETPEKKGNEDLRTGTRTHKIFTLLQDNKPHTRKELWNVIGIPEKKNRNPHVTRRVIEYLRGMGKEVTVGDGGTVTLTR
jgi:hypothetical protein